MKKLFSSLVLAGAMLVAPVSTSAGLNPTTMIDSPELYEVDATAYCNPNNNLTYTGRKTIEGLTVATCEEWLGCTILVWTINDAGEYEFYGFLESMDTGSNQKLREGQAIDIYMNSYDDCINWGRRKVMIQIVRAKG